MAMLLHSAEILGPITGSFEVTGIVTLSQKQGEKPEDQFVPLSQASDDPSQVMASLKPNFKRGR